MESLWIPIHHTLIGNLGITIFHFCFKIFYSQLIESKLSELIIVPLVKITYLWITDSIKELFANSCNYFTRLQSNMELSQCPKAKKKGKEIKNCPSVLVSVQLGLYLPFNW